MIRSAHEAFAERPPPSSFHNLESDQELECRTAPTRAQRVRLAAKVSSILRATDWTLTHNRPGRPEICREHAGMGPLGLGRVSWSYSCCTAPSTGTGLPSFVAYLLTLVALMTFNAYFHHLVRSNRAITARWVVALCMVDVILLSAAVAISNGFSHYFFHLLYYPPLAFFAAVSRLFQAQHVVWVTIVAAVYLGLSLTAGDGLDLEARDEKPLLARIFVMYVVVVVVNLISRFERARWRQSLEREQALLRERTEVSQGHPRHHCPVRVHGWSGHRHCEERCPVTLTPSSPPRWRPRPN